MTTQDVFDTRDCSAGMYENRKGSEKVGVQLSPQFAARVIIGEDDAIWYLQFTLEQVLSEPTAPIGST